MPTRRDVFNAVPAAGAMLAVGESLGPDEASAQDVPQVASWNRSSLVPETVTGPNGAVTTQVALEANAKWGITEPPAASRVVPGVYIMSGWALGQGMAVEAPEGWIIIDTGDSIRAATEMRAALERLVGGRIKVAAILYTHWHYADGTAAFMDEGTEIWGHEWLDANRTASSGVSIKSGFYRARAAAQFGVFHPVEGPDAFPNRLGFTPEKLTAKSGYIPPARLFRHGVVERFTIAGEEVEVAPNRTDTSDSVGFHFPARRALMSNFMVPGGFFNIYSLRGGPFRDPLPFLEDARWMESRNAEVLIDLHSAPVTGEENVRASIRRAADQVQIIHDQTLRWIARGMDGREAAENIYIPALIRDGWENYGQVESHVRQIYNGTVGWFGNDVYDINPLSLKDEASRTIAMAGGADAVRKQAASAAATGMLADWQWALRLTTLLLQLDPDDASARQIRVTAARALAQRTTSANARGWYMNEALDLEGQLKVKGVPVSMNLIRAVLGTPSVEDLAAAPVAANLEFLRFLVDPRSAEGKDIAFTLEAAGENGIWSLHLRNGVLVTGTAQASAASHLRLTRTELAEFILGRRTLGEGAAFATFDACLDRSGLKPLDDAIAAALGSPDEERRLTVFGEQ
ncbi:MAG: MBL fold metallo-hydrolase [Aestuariivirga sp.]|nr:MBL fold metallo-hydrolase [Aestuariivirga sp.]